MIRSSFICLIITFSVQVNSAPDCDLKSIFRTPPRRNYDQLEIMERSNFDQDDQATPTTSSSTVEKPKSFANAQVMLRFGENIVNEGRKCACGDVCPCKCPPPLLPICYQGYPPFSHPVNLPVSQSVFPAGTSMPRPCGQPLIPPVSYPPLSPPAYVPGIPPVSPPVLPPVSSTALPPVSPPCIPPYVPGNPPLPPLPQCFCVPPYQIPPYTPYYPYPPFPTYPLPQPEPLKPACEEKLEIDNVVPQDNCENNQENVVNQVPQLISNNIVQPAAVNDPCPLSNNNNLIQPNIVNEAHQCALNDVARTIQIKNNNHPQIFGPVIFPETAIEETYNPRLPITNEQIEEDIRRLDSEEINTPKPEIVNKFEPSLITPNVKFINIDIDDLSRRRGCDKTELDRSLLPYSSCNHGQVQNKLLVTYPIFRRPLERIVLPELNEMAKNPSPCVRGYRISSASSFYSDPAQTLIYRKPTVMSIVYPTYPRPPCQKQYYNLYSVNPVKFPVDPHPTNCACYGCAKYRGELNERGF